MIIIQSQTGGIHGVRESFRLAVEEDNEFLEAKFAIILETSGTYVMVAKYDTKAETNERLEACYKALNNGNTFSFKEEF